MAITDALQKLMELDGCLGGCAVDSNSGMMLGAVGAGNFNFEVAAAVNTEVVRAKRKAMKALGLADHIEDILISLGKQFHLIRPLTTNDAIFIYVVLDRSKANLAMARIKLAAVEKEVKL
jgi:predicted regulator of Ras-like GTPase activity (Roadblock/LC7/MglB family)